MKLLSALAIFAIIASAASRAGDQEFVVSQDFAVAEKKNQAQCRIALSSAYLGRGAKS